MKSVRIKIITPLGTFYSKGYDAPDSVQNTQDEEFLQSICKDGTRYQMEIEDGSLMHMPKQMIQQSLFFVEVRQKGEDEL